MADPGLTDVVGSPADKVGERNAAGKTLVVHGHFYQPPREFPGSSELPVEPSASPWHDWNARINAECYHPNTAAEILDGEGRVADLVSNFERLSFNVGPTLLAWMANHAPSTYDRIIAAGQLGRGAIAQGFNHAILPLCNERDLRTQIRWGLADFRHRFGRESEGFWLPECAVDDATLAALADEGVQFTILAPYQTGGGHAGVADWADGQMRLVLYDAALSGDVAFGIGAMSSEALIERVVASADPVVTIATDGETFGHHHHFADRTLAHALTDAATLRGVRVTTAAEIALHPTVPPTKVLESAWSCAHGIERWRSDCGCQTGRGVGWHQRWRAPLREALDGLRDAAVATFERRAAPLVVGGDPWATRDAYVDVVIGARSWPAFAAEHAHGRKAASPVLHELLEGQRAAMAMYTSCGWFFDDIAGIEARIVLRWAFALIESTLRIGEQLPEAHFARTLAQAIGNDGLNGDDVWAEVQRETRFATVERRWAAPINPRQQAVEAVMQMLRSSPPGAATTDAWPQREGLEAIACELGVSPTPAAVRSAV